MLRKCVIAQLCSGALGHQEGFHRVLHSAAFRL